MDDSVLTDDSMENFDGERPKGERWAPVGAVAPSPPTIMGEQSHVNMADQLRNLEEEQEQLNSSLLALTSHFAQVQFRLKQVVTAPGGEKESLLKELEEFAFKGCPDVRGSKSQDANTLEDDCEREHESKITEQREKQAELISQLKNQLEDIETFAYEEGTGDLPHTKVLEKQETIIDQLKNKLDLNLEDFEKLSTDELKQRVDCAIGRIVNPAKVKEQVIHQLKNQIVDLERFVVYLQDEAQSPLVLSANEEPCECEVHKLAPPSRDIDAVSDGGSDTQCCTHPGGMKPRKKARGKTKEELKKIRESNISNMKKALAVLQYITISQLGCGTDRMKERTRRGKDDIGADYYDLLQALDKATEQVIELAKKKQIQDELDKDYYDSDSSDSPVSRPLDEVTIAVRRELAPALRALFEHGLVRMSTSQALMTPITACLAPQRSAVPNVHAWEVFSKYFEIKKGKQFAESPARRLSQAFDLDIVGGTAITSRQTLLAAIDHVEATHQPLRRSNEARFKAFVCQALNEQKLASWCRLVCRTHTLMDSFYQSSSYMLRSGFDGGIQILDKLSDIKFCLPVDLAIKQFQNIRDAF
ncbi:RUN domain-containing protein 1 [Strongylocentrotus purpuratus]|uniref:RUN domain-containing protein 1 n=1 Tax=Strongylocentrotus purpuratus TaxID=7668 RepID=A0A7M7PBB4_STRPU|nr:RUN domain-containing protein 1 [Strongylocentrotus purpuratus]